MRKFFNIFFILTCVVQISEAQQVPLYSQYMMNGFLLNPAVAGRKMLQKLTQSAAKPDF
jgi:hypothetical protein